MFNIMINLGFFINFLKIFIFSICFQPIVSKVDLAVSEVSVIQEVKAVVEDSIKSIAAVAEETAASSEEITASIEEQSASATELTRQANVVKELNEDITKIVTKYKL